MLKKYKKYKSYIIIVALLLAISAETALLVYDPQETSTSTLAAQVIEKCSTENYKPGCYDKEIPKLMDKISMETAFEVASLVQLQDDSYGYCHILGHELSSKEVSKDVGDWASVLKRCPVGICSNGCMHGAAQERFRNEVLEDIQLEQVYDELIGVCDPTEEWELTGLEQSECYHGLGHLSIYVTGAEVERAVKVCDEIGISLTDGDLRKLCYEGLFMQIFQPVDSEDKDLVAGVAPAKDDLRSYCEEFDTETVIEACWQEGFPLFKPDVFTSSGTEEFCAQSMSERSKNSCYNIMFYIMAQSSNYDQPKLLNYCSGLAGKFKGDCFGYVANAIIHGSDKNITKATEFCRKASEFGQEDACFSKMIEHARYNVKTQTPAFAELCTSLPVIFKEQCEQLNY